MRAVHDGRRTIAGMSGIGPPLFCALMGRVLNPSWVLCIVVAVVTRSVRPPLCCGKRYLFVSGVEGDECRC